MLTKSHPRTVVIVPIKPLSLSKSRLSPVLSNIRRNALSLMLLHHVLDCIEGTRQEVESWITGGDRTVRTVSYRRGIRFLEDPGSGPNETIEMITRQAFQQGADSTVYLPPDLPFLQSSDLDALMDISESLTTLVLAPAERDGGTNAMLMPKGICFRPYLGEGNSFKKHKELALLNEWPLQICQAPGFAMDLDTPEDFTMCIKRIPYFIDQLQNWETFLRTDQT